MSIFPTSLRHLRHLRLLATIPNRLLATISTDGEDGPSRKFKTTSHLDAKLEFNLTKLSLALHGIGDAATASTENAAHSLEPPPNTTLTFHLPRNMSHTPPDVMDLLSFFAAPPYNQTLHPFYFLQLLAGATEILAARSAIVHPSLPVGSKIHVIGDLHGSLPDLNHIVSTLGPPNAMNQYIFNGDFVDRGTHGVEVVSVLLAFLVSAPNAVWLNRGNHEDSSVSKAYGFHSEVMDKYGDKNLWDHLGVFFAALPLATVIPSSHNGGAFVVHAGIGSGVIGDVEKGGASVLKNEDVSDLLWSDPDMEFSGIRCNDARGAGKIYGTDVIADTLTAFQVNNFVRSHQQVYNGVDISEVGSGQHLYTVFSVTNYPNFEGCNEAGYLTFGGGEIEITRFESEECDLPMDTSSFHYGMTSMENTLKGEIFLHKATIHEALLEASKDGRRVTVAQWVVAMKTATGLDIEWSSIQPLISAQVQRVKMVKGVTSELEATGEIDINHFLSHFEQGVIEGEEIFRRSKQLYVLFKHLDANGSGGISRDEFALGVGALNQHLGEGEKIEEESVEDLFCALDVDGNGVLDLEEWKRIAESW